MTGIKLWKDVVLNVMLQNRLHVLRILFFLTLLFILDACKVVSNCKTTPRYNLLKTKLIDYFEQLELKVELSVQLDVSSCTDGQWNTQIIPISQLSSQQRRSDQMYGPGCMVSIINFQYRNYQLINTSNNSKMVSTRSFNNIQSSKPLYIFIYCKYRSLNNIVFHSVIVRYKLELKNSQFS